MIFGNNNVAFIWQKHQWADCNENETIYFYSEKIAWKKNVKQTNLETYLFSMGNSKEVKGKR